MIKPELYKKWWDAMDACNSSGLIKSMAVDIDEVWKEAHELGKGTDYVNSHPLMIIFADKLLQLAGISFNSTSSYIDEKQNAYAEVRAKVRVKIDP